MAADTHTHTGGEVQPGLPKPEFSLINIIIYLYIYKPTAVITNGWNQIAK
jgi:hypothetical protein